MRSASFVAGAIALGLSSASLADVTVNYTHDLGGNNSDPLNGLAARATFAVDGTTLTVLLENTSTGIPFSFEVSDSLLVSVGFNLLNGVAIVSGDAAIIGPGSVGLGDWSDRFAGDSVAEEWLWTNDFGGDFMINYAQVISTSNGQGGGTTTTFDGIVNGNVGGPFGGIAAAPPFLDVPNNQHAVSNSILFTLTLSDTIGDDDLASIAAGSIVEYGSDQRYLGVPSPAALPVLAVAALYGRTRRRSR